MAVDLCISYRYAHAHSDDLDLDFENVCKTRPACLYSVYYIFPIGELAMENSDIATYSKKVHTKAISFFDINYWNQ